MFSSLHSIEALRTDLFDKLGKGNSSDGKIAMRWKKIFIEIPLRGTEKSVALRWEERFSFNTYRKET